jgi:polysaccharide pyruvyl transferase WcaK-like protein
VVMCPWGPAEDCYRWPYYFARSSARRRASEELAEGYAAIADELIQQDDAAVALIADEELDERIVQRVFERMHHRDGARMFSSRELNASQMTTLFRELDLLVTSRYHACILSLEAAVPQLAVGHDLRLKTLYEELGLALNFISPGPGMFTQVRHGLRHLLSNPEPVRSSLSAGYAEHLRRARQNRQLLATFVAEHGFTIQRSWQMAA